MNKKLFNYWSLKILGLYANNINKILHGREIAKKLKANQRTIMLNLNKLEKEKILISEIKGRNKEFCLNKKNEITKQFIILSEIFKSLEIINHDFQIYSIIKDLKEKTQGIIILYGSHAKEEFTKESDIDLLILGKIDKEYLHEIKSKYPLDIHFMDMPKKEFVQGMKDKPFIKEVISNHIIFQGVEEFSFWMF